MGEEVEIGPLHSIEVESEQSLAIEDDLSGIIYLDRQRVECPGETFLSSSELKASGRSIYFASTCTTYAAKRDDCESISSGYNDPGYALIFLDRHDLSCPLGKALTGFRGATKDGVFEFQGECCAGVYEAPTMAPSFPPTLRPIPEPTESPVALPTLSPTKPAYKEPIISAMYAVQQGGILAIKHDKCKQTSGGELAAMDGAINACGCQYGQKYIDVTEVENYHKNPEDYAYCKCNNLQLTQDNPSGRAVGKDFAISGADYGGYLFFVLKPIYKEYADVACTSPEPLVEKLPPPLYCPVTFSYPKYDSKFVPSGCTLISSADFGWDLLEVDSRGIYACASRHTKDVRMDRKMLTKFDLITKTKSLISYVNPADDVSAEFFSNGDFTGESAIFWKDPGNNVVNFRYPGKSDRSNDNVFSIILSSTAETIPEDCDALEKLVKAVRPVLPKEHEGIKEEGKDQKSVDVGPEGRDVDQNPQGGEGGLDEPKVLVEDAQHSAVGGVQMA